jgi:CMP-N-acetylneuraminic acid synthetase
MKIIGIIPAREGSKRLKHKNIYPLKGIPLIEYTIKAALESKYFTKDNLYINSNFDEVFEIAKQYNLKSIIRPDNLSDDKTWTQDVIDHTDDVIGNLEDEDIIVLLQANSPQIIPEKINECIDMLLKNNLWQVNTVDTLMVNNGAIQVLKRKVRNHKGKVNYNGIVTTDWIDVHTIEDIKKLEEII